MNKSISFENTLNRVARAENNVEALNKLDTTKLSKNAQNFVEDVLSYAEIVIEQANKIYTKLNEVEDLAAKDELTKELSRYATEAEYCAKISQLSEDAIKSLASKLTAEQFKDFAREERKHVLSIIEALKTKDAKKLSKTNALPFVATLKELAKSNKSKFSRNKLTRAFEHATNRQSDSTIKYAFALAIIKEVEELRDGRTITDRNFEIDFDNATTKALLKL